MIPPLLWSLANFYDKVLISDLFSNVYSFMFFTNLLSPIALIGIFFSGYYQGVSLLHGLVLIVMGIIYLASFIFYSKALEIEEGSKIGSLFVLTTIFVLIIEYLFLGTKLSLMQYFASFIIIIFSLVLINSSNLVSIYSIFRINRAFIYMIINTLTLAFFFVFLSYFLDKYSFLSVIFWVFIGESLFLCSLLFSTYSKNKILKSAKKISFNKKMILILISVNIFAVLPDLLYTYVLSIAPSVALVSVISNIQYGFLFLFGIIFTKAFPKYIYENIEIKQLIIKAFSTLGIIGGVILIQL